MNGDWEGIIFRRGTVAWAPLPTLNYNSHIGRNVGPGGLQGRWGRQEWSAAFHICNPNQKQECLGWRIYQDSEYYRTHKIRTTGGPIIPRRDRYFPHRKTQQLAQALAMAMAIHDGRVTIGKTHLIWSIFEN